MSEPLWQPSLSHIENSHLFRFIQFIEKNYAHGIQDYDSLYHWSIINLESFWEAIWAYCKIKHSCPPIKILTEKKEIWNAEWFKGAKLNFAENLLRKSDNSPAIFFCNENLKRSTLTYEELTDQVTKFSCALKNRGIIPGDRVIGLMPNIPETVIAMLGTTALGGIWSACSPEFGPEAILDRFNQINPKILVVTDGFLYKGSKIDNTDKIAFLSKHIPSLKSIVIIPYIYEKSISLKLPNEMINYNKFLDVSTINFKYTQLDFNHPLYILYSSGTTGRPKCIVHSIGGTLLQHFKELMLHVNLKTSDKIFYYTNVGWMMWNWLVSSLAVGSSIVLFDGSPFLPKKDILFDLIDELKIDIFGTSAKFISTLEKGQMKPLMTHSLKSLRTILSTGSPLMDHNFDYVYKNIKKEVQLSSISGGTDIISCFALGNPMKPVYRGELQSIGLGMKVEIFNEKGTAQYNEKGELVCTAPFPSMPVSFWNDPNKEKYHKTYFSKFPNVWHHGDFAKITSNHGMIIYGRSDSTLKPGGVRIGTAEIYHQVEKINEILDSIAIGQNWKEDIRIILFVVLKKGYALDYQLKHNIIQVIKENTSPRHVPKLILQVNDIPRTLNGKKSETAVYRILHNIPIDNAEALENPGSLEQFKHFPELA